MSLFDVAKRFFRKGIDERHETLRRVAKGWMAGGFVIVVFVAAFAVAHFVYDMPVQDRDTGQLATPEKIEHVLIMIGGGGFFFALAGILLWKVGRHI